MSLSTRKLVKAGLLVALTVVLGFALSSVPNVELVTVSIFTAGLYLGIRGGVVVGGMATTLFTTFNPLGMPYPPVAVAQVLWMMVVGGMGGFLRKRLVVHSSLRRATALGICGFCLTLGYDLLTNAAFALTGGLANRILSVMAAGLVFSVVHLISNTVLFTAMAAVFTRFTEEHETSSHNIS